MANYNGTLAAVRTLGRAGIPVTTVDPSPLAVSAWSRYVTTRLRAPSVRATDRFATWLTNFGRTHEQHVLLPTSDDTAWLYSRHHQELSRYFYLLSPPLEVTYRLLNKALLHDEATAAGLAVPRTWFPDTPADLDRCRREARFPVLVKPRTQVLFRTHSKGAYVEAPPDLAWHYNVIANQPYENSLLEYDTLAGRPMVQEFHREAASGIYNISAYVHAGRICGARAANKVLQLPRRLGIGVCFEDAPIVPHLLAGLERLVARLGFTGVFEAEFIRTGDTSLLIDFNPRFYNQMAFDIARGLPMPLLAYYDAVGDRNAFDALCASANSDHNHAAGSAFSDRLGLRIMLSAQRLARVLSRAEHDQWRRWLHEHRDNCVDALIDPQDPLPLWAGIAQTMGRYARHPRHFIRSIVLNKY
jgi:D-aspartate ligase